MNRKRTDYVKRRERIAKKMLEESSDDKKLPSCPSGDASSGVDPRRAATHDLKDKVADWIATLDANRLQRLREIAALRLIAEFRVGVGK